MEESPVLVRVKEQMGQTCSEFLLHCHCQQSRCRFLHSHRSHSRYLRRRDLQFWLRLHHYFRPYPSPRRPQFLRPTIAAVDDGGTRGKADHRLSDSDGGALDALLYSGAFDDRDEFEQGERHERGEEGDGGADYELDRGQGVNSVGELGGPEGLVQSRKCLSAGAGRTWVIGGIAAALLAEVGPVLIDQLFTAAQAG